MTNPQTRMVTNWYFGVYYWRPSGRILRAIDVVPATGTLQPWQEVRGLPAYGQVRAKASERRPRRVASAAPFRKGLPLCPVH